MSYCIKTYEFTVRGFPTVEKVGRRRGKLLASVFRDYQSGYDGTCTFKEFLQICGVCRIANPDQKKIWVSGKEATQVGPEQGSSIPFMREEDDTPLWSHVDDVSFEQPSTKGKANG